MGEHEEAIEEFGESVTGEAKRRLDAEGVPAEIAMVPKRGPEALADATWRSGLFSSCRPSGSANF